VLCGWVRGGADDHERVRTRNVRGPNHANGGRANNSPVLWPRTSHVQGGEEQGSVARSGDQVGPAGVHTSPATHPHEDHALALTEPQAPASRARLLAALESE
jgi:hypothetical protein